MLLSIYITVYDLGVLLYDGRRLIIVLPEQRTVQRDHIGGQIIRDHAGFSVHSRKRPVLFRGKARAIRQIHGPGQKNETEQFSGFERRRHLSQNASCRSGKLQGIGFFGLLHCEGQYRPLSLGSLKIVSLRITDPAVCRGLNTAQMLHSRIRDLLVIDAQLIIHIFHVAVHILHLFICDLQIDPAERIDRVCKTFEADRDEIGDIEKRIKKINEKLAEIEQERESILANVSGSMFEQMSEGLKDLNKQESEYAHQLEDLIRQQDDCRRNVLREESARELLKGLKPLTDFDDSLLGRILAKIEAVSKEKIVVTFCGGYTVTQEVE